MSDVIWALRTGTRLLGRGGGRRTLAAVVGATAAAAAGVGLSMVSAWLIVRASEQPPVLHLMVAIVTVRALGLARGLLRYLERLLGHDLALRVLAELRGLVVGALAGVVPGRVAADDDDWDPGRILAGVVDDVDALVDAWVRVALPVAAAVALAVGTSAGVALIDPLIAAVLVVSALAALVVGAAATIVATHRRDLHLAPVRADLSATAVETLSAASELAVLGHLDARIAAADALVVSMRDVQSREARRAGWASALGTGVAGIALCCVIAASDRITSTESVAVAVFGLLAVHEVVSTAVHGLQRVPSMSAAAGRIRRLADQAAALADADRAGTAPSDVVGIVVSDLVARWPGATTDAVVLDALDARVGRATLVTAPSGGGKSTLAAVLSGSIRPAQGTVTLIGGSDRVDTDELSAREIRRVVLWAPQEVMVFDTSLRENLVLARPDATDDDVRVALGTVGLGDWLGDLPRGLDTRLDASRDVVSGGQARRLGVARALLADRAVTVFDEPTEHLDEVNAREIAGLIEEVARRRVVIVATHRPDLFPGAQVAALPLAVRVGAFSDQGPV